ncbi:MAG: dTDP-4-dehydrorhamnose reductase [Sedimentisphaerales bacterium]|nr:dTDP-4-dehydrorhamnose reductase [Sedimentisphaerales bacterium]
MADNDRSIVVLGGRGMLGTDLAKALCRKGLEPTVFDLPELDITDNHQLSEAIAENKTIVNCAAYTDVEKAESQSELAFKVNAEAVGQIGKIAAERSAKVLHISTDFVFDGKLERPYVETDAPNALSVYGKSKLEGEKLLQSCGCQYCIIRVQWTYGDNGNNFVKKLIDIAKQGKPLRVVDDQVGSPTATKQIAAAVCELIRDLPDGLYHYAASGYVSRFDMARFIFDKIGIDAEPSRCRSSDFETAAQRPLNSRFDCSKISSLLRDPVEPWQKYLEKYLEQFRE